MYGVTFPMSSEAMSDGFLLPIGKAKIEREGSDVTIVAHSKMVTHSLEAAEELAKEGIPLPFGSRFWASNWPTGKSPLPGLIIHLIPSVSCRSSSPLATI